MKQAGAATRRAKRPTSDRVVAKRTLAQTLIEELRAQIQGGALKPGERLPTEQALSQRFGVSRTVVREAVAALRADRLVEPKQGAGVFVLEPPEPAFGVGPTDDGPLRISAAIETLELRAAVEIEAAGLAAQRSSPAQQARIREHLYEIERAVERGERAEAADFEFHLSIADATNNPRFHAFLAYLGGRAIPRARMREEVSIDRDYLRRIHAEHCDILSAIAAGDPAAAREAMRVHLKGSQERYQRLAQPGG